MTRRRRRRRHHRIHPDPTPENDPCTTVVIEAVRPTSLDTRVRSAPPCLSSRPRPHPIGSAGSSPPLHQRRRRKWWAAFSLFARVRLRVYRPARPVHTVDPATPAARAHRLLVRLRQVRRRRRIPLEVCRRAAALPFWRAPPVPFPRILLRTTIKKKKEKKKRKKKHTSGHRHIGTMAWRRGGRVRHGHSERKRRKPVW